MTNETEFLILVSLMLLVFAARQYLNGNNVAAFFMSAVPTAVLLSFVVHAFR